MPLRRCLGCGALTRYSRCVRCRAEQRAKYTGDWATRSRQAIAAHRAQHGDTCPGYDDWHQPHASTDLVLDHATNRVICRAANTAARNRGLG